MDLKAVITVDRDEIIAKLEERVKVLTDRHNQHYDEDLKKLNEILSVYTEEDETSDSYAERVAKYHEELAVLIRNGDISVSTTGVLRRGKKSVPKKPKMNDGGTQFEYRGFEYRGYSTWTRSNLEEERRRINSYLEQSLTPINAAIELLKMSKRKTVEIDSAQFQELLSGVRRGW